MALLITAVEFMLNSTKRRRISSCDTYAAECSEIEDYEDEGPEPGNKSPSNSSKRQKRLHVSPFICPPFDDFLYLCCNGGRIRPLSRKTLQMGMQIFFKFCTVQFNSLREIKSLRFRASDGTTCSAYRNGSDGQWQHLLDFLYVDEQSWIEVHIGDDENDDLDLEIWFQCLDPSQILEVSFSRVASSHDNLPIIY